MVLADSCRGFNLATPSSSVTYCKCVTNRACQEGRKSGLSLIGFLTFCACCPLHMSMHVCLWQNSGLEGQLCHYNTHSVMLAMYKYRHAFCFFLKDRRFILQDRPIFAYVCLSTRAPSGLPLEPNVLQKTAWIRKSLFCFRGKNSKPPQARVMEVPGITDGSPLELILL